MKRNLSNGVSKLMNIASSNIPYIHVANEVYTSGGSSVVWAHVEAETVWPNRNHYTRAYYKNRFTNNYHQDSGRVYGTDYTKAVSGVIESSSPEALLYIASSNWGQ